MDAESGKAVPTLLQSGLGFLHKSKFPDLMNQAVFPSARKQASGGKANGVVRQVKVAVTQD